MIQYILTHINVNDNLLSSIYMIVVIDNYDNNGIMEEPNFGLFFGFTILKFNFNIVVLYIFLLLLGAPYITIGTKKLNRVKENKKIKKL